MRRAHFGRTLLAAVLAAALMLPAAVAVTYQDTAGHWASAAIETWSNRGVIQGSGGSFRPNGDITRGEMATILQNVMHFQKQAENTYRDLDDNFYTVPILKATAAGIMRGANGEVRPKDPITRQEAAVLIANAFGFPPDGAPEASYADQASIADWAVKQVNVMSAAGYMQGNNGLFQPDAHFTRAQAVQLLDNIIKGFYYQRGAYTSGVDGNALVNTGGVTLENLTIKGDLYLTAGAVGEPVVLNNVTVTGDIVNQSGQEPVVNEQKPEETDPPVETDPPDETDPPEENPLVTEAEIKAFLAQYPDKGMIGIDVSSHQGEIDWAKVKAAGVEFAMLRVGNTGYGTGSINLDKYFHQNIRAAQKNGIEVGVYYFSQAISVDEALAEANFVLDAISGYDFTFPVVFDWETSSVYRNYNVDVQTLCDAANAFCGLVESRGYTPMVYFNKKLATERYDLNQVDQYDFWYAYYQPSASIPTGHDHTMWQFTSTGKVPGITGNVDLNMGYYDYANPS